ncbi:MAG: glycosyltransferase [Bacteroidota bacterium]|nr:glycosyltransferase [Bacteroidota bacterium]
MKKFTLVTTVFNEMSRLDQTIHDIENQTIIPDEIIITDAGSKDGTFEKLLDWKKNSNISIVILQKVKCNVAEGRNFAIKTSKNSLIVSTDFGCRFHPQWLESITSPFVDPSVQVVGGTFTVIEDDITSLSSKAAYILSNGYQCKLDQHFVPSSRSIAYYKIIWEQIGGYPEWLSLAADDLVFGLMLKNKNISIHLVDKPFVYWGRHITPKAYGKEAFRYGLGDGEAQVNFRNFISNGIETFLRWGLFSALIFTMSNWIFYGINLYYLLFTIPFLFGLRSYKNAFQNWIQFKSKKYNLTILLYTFYLVEITRFHYIKGYLKGLFNRTEEQKIGQKTLNASL